MAFFPLISQMRKLRAPGPSGWIKSQQDLIHLKSQDANQLPSSQENVLSPEPGYLFHGPATWKAVAASLTTQNYNYMPQITRARGQEPEPRSDCLLALHLMVWVSRWSSDPIREGKANTQTRTSSSRIKSPLGLNPWVTLLGNFKESLSSDPRRGMAFIAEVGETQCNWTLINNETTKQKRRTQKRMVMTRRERQRVTGTSACRKVAFKKLGLVLAWDWNTRGLCPRQCPTWTGAPWAEVTVSAQLKIERLHPTWIQERKTRAHSQPELPGRAICDGAGIGSTLKKQQKNHMKNTWECWRAGREFSQKSIQRPV